MHVVTQNNGTSQFCDGLYTFRHRKCEINLEKMHRSFKRWCGEDKEEEMEFTLLIDLEWSD